jgi:hypothetical protein
MQMLGETAQEETSEKAVKTRDVVCNFQEFSCFQVVEENIQCSAGLTSFPINKTDPVDFSRIMTTKGRSAFTSILIGIALINMTTPGTAVQMNHSLSDNLYSLSE